MAENYGTMSSETHYVRYRDKIIILEPAMYLVNLLRYYHSQWLWVVLIALIAHIILLFHAISHNLMSITTTLQKNLVLSKCLFVASPERYFVPYTYYFGLTLRAGTVRSSGWPFVERRWRRICFIANTESALTGVSILLARWKESFGRCPRVNACWPLNDGLDGTIVNGLTNRRCPLFQPPTVLSSVHKILLDV